MKREEYTSANRIAWNEAAPVHKKSRFDDLLNNFKQPGYSYLDKKQTEIFQNIGLQGKSIAQLCCNNGRELLSLKNLGAGRCVGFDISDEFIKHGHELAKAGNIECELLQSDVYEIPDKFNAQFDIVFITIGAINLMPDVKKLFEVVARLLKKGGVLFVYEMHPFMDMFSWEDKSDPPVIQYSYFRNKPLVLEDMINYWDMSTYKSSPMYWFHHKISDVITACIENGLNLEMFKEYEHDVSSTYAHLEGQKNELPLSYAMIARKK